jgi:hypothetical protein
VQRTTDRNTPTGRIANSLAPDDALGAVARNCAVIERDHALEMDAAPPAHSVVVADGTIGQRGLAFAGNVQAAAFALGVVVAKGAVDHCQRAAFHILDRAAAPAVEAGCSDAIGGIVADSAIDHRQHASVVPEAATAIGQVVADDAVRKRQCALVLDAAARSKTFGRATVPNRHRLNSDGGPLSDEKDAVGGFARLLVSLDNGVLRALPLDGDVFGYGDACFGVDGIGNVNDVPGSSICIVNRCLDGGEITAGSAHGDGVPDNAER